MVWFHEGFPIVDEVEVLLGSCLRTEISEISLTLKSIQTHKQREKSVSLARGTFLTHQFGG